MTIAGRSFSVVGLGRSGVAAANALAIRGGDVLASDAKPDAALASIRVLLHPGVQVQAGREVVRPGDVAVLSPGIPPNAWAFREAGRVASEVIGEVELFARLWPGRIVAITGTDGKSTTTTLTAHLLKACGMDAIAAGNLGNPLCELLDDAGCDRVAVAEVSCFQLLTTDRFRPLVALVTNLAEDHTEHHGSLNAYLRAKARVVMRQAYGDWFVRNLDDPRLALWMTPDSRLAPDNGQTVLEVSCHRAVTNGAFVLDDTFFLARDGQRIPVCARADFPAIGAHNAENAVLALAATLPFAPDPSALASGLRSYRGLPHRLEFVRECQGVRFYNDSKATNPHAAITALRAFDTPVVLIAGGHEKGLDYAELAVEVGRHCAAVVLAGECANRMAREFPDGVQKVRASSWDEAIGLAFDLARPQGVVLMSPASSSYDAFTNFEARGDWFRAAVQAL